MKEFVDWLKTDEGKEETEKFFCEIAKKEKIKRDRFKRFKKWLKENDFDQLLTRLISEHDDEYIQKCYDRGYMPYPNRKMSFLFNYVTDMAGKKVKVKELDCTFANAIWEFKGYYFQIIWGQGAIEKIYNKNDLNQIFSI